jgi:uncharacterized membrane protein
LLPAQLRGRFFSDARFLWSGGLRVDVVVVSVVLFAVAFVMLLLGVLLVMLSALREGARVEGGAVVIVGPVPLAFGTSERVTRALLVAAIVLTALSIILFLMVSCPWLGR